MIGRRNRRPCWSIRNGRLNPRPLRSLIHGPWSRNQSRNDLFLGLRDTREIPKRQWRSIRPRQNISQSLRSLSRPCAEECPSLSLCLIAICRQNRREKSRRTGWASSRHGIRMIMTPRGHKHRKNTLRLPERTIRKSRQSTTIIHRLICEIIRLLIDQPIVAPEHDPPSVAIAYTEANTRQNCNNASNGIVSHRGLSLHIGGTNTNICKRERHRNECQNSMTPSITFCRKKRDESASTDEQTLQ